MHDFNGLVLHFLWGGKVSRMHAWFWSSIGLSLCAPPLYPPTSDTWAFLMTAIIPFFWWDQLYWRFFHQGSESQFPNTFDKLLYIFLKSFRRISVVSRFRLGNQSDWGFTHVCIHWKHTANPAGKLWKAKSRSPCPPPPRLPLPHLWGVTAPGVTAVLSDHSSWLGV